MSDATTGEEWRSVVGYDGIYDVSSFGRVKRVGRAFQSGNGYGGGAVIGKIIVLSRIKGGYFAVNLWQEGKLKRFLIHTLVANAFHGAAPKGTEVNHKDGDKSNNAASNLEYLTRSENILHAYKNGLYAKGDAHPFSKQIGESHPLAKLTLKDVHMIRTRYRPKIVTFQMLADEYHVNNSTIQRIVKGKIWARFPQPLLAAPTSEPIDADDDFDPDPEDFDADDHDIDV